MSRTRKRLDSSRELNGPDSLACMNDHSSAQSVFVLIPAYQPDKVLSGIVRRLAQADGICGVVVVDDGSDARCRPIFDEIGQIKGAHVLRHFTNLGKGMAIKTGLNYGACTFDGCVGAITADADGQHRTGDILKVADTLRQNRDCLVLGSRAFSGNVPLRSRFGNRLTCLTMKTVVGQKISDTQTGLRGIPTRMIPRLLKLRSAGYEFELDMLLLCKYERIRIVETGIETIYIDNNQSSHFNPIMDSMRIYFLLLRFLIVSILSALIDNAIFAVTFILWPDILGSQIAGRIGGTTFNYLANKKVVFHSTAPNKYALPKYLILVVCSGAASYGLILLMVSMADFNPITAKLLAETVLFILNFLIQRDFVFTRRPAPAVAA